MQVHHHVLATAGKIALGGVAVLAFAALAGVGAHMGMRMSAGSLRSAAPRELLSGPESGSSASSPSEAATDEAPRATPAEVLAARFPTEETTPQPLTFSASRMIPGEGEVFDLAALSGLATVEPPWPAADGAAPAATPEGQDQAAPSEPPKARRPSARSPNVLNDAQIASIRQRLKLTAEQARLWPAVEAALRKIVYTRTALNQRSGGQSGATGYIDPSSPEVQELKSAALPLLMRLNDEQKREVRTLAYVMGLEAVASQF